jgi:hypothetical protein
MQDEGFQTVEAHSDILLNIFARLSCKPRLGAPFTEKENGEYNHQRNVNESRPIIGDLAGYALNDC